MTTADGPLAHLRVLEIASLYAAPFIGKILRDYGAEVVKVEDVSGDQLRGWAPIKNGLSLTFARLNADKKSVAINLREERGRDLVRRLVGQFDIVIENFRPGRLEEWGLGYEDLRKLNPELVMVRVSGFGQTGPDSHRPGFATVAEAVSGIAYINGWPDRPPTSPPFGLGDYVAGLAGAFGAMAAIARRERGGGGQEVDVAIYQPLLAFFGDAVLRYSALGEVVERSGNSGGGTSPRGIYQTSDGKWVAISGSSQNVAERLFRVMGHGDLLEDPRFATNAARVTNDAIVNDLVREWVGERTREEVLRLLDDAEVASGPVNTAPDILADEHFRARGSVRDYVSEAFGPVAQTGPVVTMSGWDRDEFHDPPGLGEHTEEVLRQAGVREDLAALQEAGVIRLSPHVAGRGGSP